MNSRCALALAALAPVAVAVAAEAPAKAATLDRVVARFSDPEAAEAAGALRFVMMRELVLEAWVVAYERALPGETPSLFDDKQLRAALERHVIEEVLSERLPDSATSAQIAKGVAAARLALRLSIGDRLDPLLAAATAGVPGGGAAELEAILLRRARAEIYLELAVAEPVDVSEGELRAAWAHPPAALRTLEFDAAVPALRVHVRALRLREAGQAYYQAVRGRLHLEIVPG